MSRNHYAAEIAALQVEVETLQTDYATLHAAIDEHQASTAVVTSPDDAKGGQDAGGPATTASQ